MKKLNVFLVLAFFALITFTSCEKDSLKELESSASDTIVSVAEVNTSKQKTLTTVSELSNPEVSVANGRLVFEDQFAFEEFMHYLEGIEVEDFIQSLDQERFSSLYVAGETFIDEEQVRIDELLAVLSQYGSIQVGEYIIRLNFDRAECYFIPLSAGKAEIEKMEQVTNPDNTSEWPSTAQIVSFEESVFDVISGEAKAFGCNIGDQSLKDVAVCSDPNIPCPSLTPACGFRGCVRARYFKGGIWFRLFAQFYTTALCTNEPYTLNIDAEWNRCGPGGQGTSDDSIEDTLRVGVTDDGEELLYSGTRRLKTYRLSTDADFCSEDKVLNTGTATIFSIP